MKMLLDTIEETQSFEITIDKKSVIHIQWKDGQDARDQLRKCVNA